MITLIISFFLDGIISIYTNNTLFVPLFTIVSLLYLYQIYEKKEKNYFILLIITGLLYDSFYTDIFILNIFVFIILGFIIKFINIYLSHKLNSNIIKLIIIIICYRVITYLILTIINYYRFSFDLLYKSIYSSIIINLIYLLVIHFIYKLKRK